MTFVGKFGSSLNVIKISWTMFMRPCSCSKFSNYRRILAAARFMHLNIHKNYLAWANCYASIIRNISNSNSMIIKNRFLYCFNVFIGFRRVWATSTSIIIDILLTFFKPVIPQLNCCCCVMLIVDSLNASVSISNVLAPLISSFHTKLNTVSLNHFSF